MIKLSQNNEMNVKVIFDGLSKMIFAMRKTSNPFSSIWIDQGHEQNNKIAIVDGSAIWLLEK